MVEEFDVEEGAGGGQAEESEETKFDLMLASWPEMRKELSRASIRTGSSISMNCGLIA